MKSIEMKKVKEHISECPQCGAPIFVIYKVSPNTRLLAEGLYPIDTEIEHTCGCRWLVGWTQRCAYPDKAEPFYDPWKVSYYYINP